MTQDDHYKEYLIPKGATIMANNWAISRDAEMYPEPEAFRPERWLGDAGKKLLPVMKYAFGFGQRTCPGRYLADALLFSHYAHILRVFDVSLPPAAEKAKVAADERMKVKSNGAAWCVLLRLLGVRWLTMRAAELRRCMSRSRPGLRPHRPSSTKSLRRRPRTGMQTATPLIDRPHPVKSLTYHTTIATYSCDAPRPDSTPRTHHFIAMYRTRIWLGYRTYSSVLVVKPYNQSSLSLS